MSTSFRSNRSRVLRLLLVTLLWAMSVGCSSSPIEPDLRGIYSRAAQEHDHRNPVIVIPGILGSNLRDAATGETVWGAFTGEAVDPESAAGARQFALPMESGKSLDELRDSVMPSGVLSSLEISLIGLPVTVAAYSQILATLGVGGYRDEELGLMGVDYGTDHYTCFQFDYDWRRDNVENAQRLHEFLFEKRAFVRSKIEERTGVAAADVQFDIVAHSMGGLVARYFLMYGSADLPEDGSPPEVTWAGNDLVDRVILIATPNAGSVDALRNLVEGVDYGIFLPTYEPAILGTMPSIYQLLPRSRHRAVVDGESRQPVEDLLDPALWERHGWGLAARDQDDILAWLLPDIQSPPERRRIARDHLRQCLSRARQFFAALDRPADVPEGLELHLIAGDAIDTPAQLVIEEDGTLDLLESAPGDGIVLRSSALMDERLSGAWEPRLVSPIPWHQVTFLFTDHLGLTRDPAFSDNALYLLLEAPR